MEETERAAAAKPSPLRGTVEAAFSLWVCEAEGWRKELTALLPVCVHLEMAQEDDRVVWPALQEHGLLIYSSH